MKRLKKNKYMKYVLSLMCLAILVIGCMTIEDIIQPDDAQVNSDIEILVKIKIDAETDGNSKLAFGILVPKSWNVAQNSTLTLTTVADFAANAVTDEPMKVIASSEVNPSDAQPWAASFQSKFGVLGNTGPVEWVVFESGTTFQINDTKPEQDVVTGTVKIRIHTGDQAVKFFMGYTFCGKAFGTSGDRYNNDEDGPVIASRILEVTGGDEPLWDYTVEPPISFVPATFTFEDIFSVKYNESNTLIGGLKGGNVYLLGKVKYEENGVAKEKSVEETSAKTLMEELGDMGAVKKKKKYIYPKDYFDIPKDVVITELQFYFANQNKTITILLDDETQDGYVVNETCE